MIVMAFCHLSLLFCVALIAPALSFTDDFESALISPERCGKGQAIWCQNFTTATECNALNHCIQSVWLVQKPEVNIGTRGLCEAIVLEMKPEIGNINPMQLVPDSLKIVCSLTLVTPEARRNCENAIDRFTSYHFSEIFALLKSDVHPSLICHILGLCSEIVLSPHDVNKYMCLNSLSIETTTVRKSENLLGVEKCTWGPTYWCQNLTSSKECKLTSHCVQKVWSKQQFPEDNDSVCKICKDMVKQARDQLQSNETQQELREVFEFFCQIIPIKLVRADCNKLADDFVDELTEMLVSEMNPTAICTVAGLCNSRYIDNLLLTSPTLPDLCVNCTVAITGIERYFQAASQSQIQWKLLRLCDQLSTYSDACTQLVIANFHYIYRTLSKELHPFSVCHMSGMCASRYHLHSEVDNVGFNHYAATKLADMDDTVTCDLCTQFVTNFKRILIINTTEEEFLEMLRGICEQTCKFTDDCLEIVNSNYHQFYTFLTKELDSQELCQQMDMCPRQNTVSDENLNLIEGFQLSPPLGDTQVAPNTLPMKLVKDVECKICVVVIRVIQKELNTSKYQNDTEQLLKEVCSLVPHSDREKCDHFIQVYADVLIKMLADQTDPEAVCTLLGTCIEGKAIAPRNELCPICQYVFHFIQEELENPADEKLIEDVVRKVCQYIPKSEESECEKFISEYGALIISILSQEIDPSLVCPALKVCPAFFTQAEYCAQCQQLMARLIRELAGDHSVNAIDEALHELVLPRTDNVTKLTALQLSILHHDDVFDMMGADFDSLESCTFLKFCDSATPVPTTKVVTMLPDQQNDEETNDILDGNDDAAATVVAVEPAKSSCELCELMVQLYEDKLASNITEKQVEDMLQDFCRRIQNPIFHSNCTYFVRKYVPVVVSLLWKDVLPKEVCAFVKLCPLHTNFTIASQPKKVVHHCEMCEAVVDSFATLIDDAPIHRQSIVSLLRLCDIFGEKDRTQCMKIISYVGPNLENSTLAIPSWYYCMTVGYCPYGAHLTFKEICVDQSEWCVDVKTALLCDKLEYCQLNVWKSTKPSQKL